MTRPTDWAPLAGSDPVPGDDHEVERLARQLTDTARAIDEQVAKLDALCTDAFWDSDAGRTFRQAAHDTGSSLAKARLRYQEAGDALRTYQPELENAQAQSIRALWQAQDAERDLHRARSGLDSLGPPPTPSPSATPPTAGQAQAAAQATADRQARVRTLTTAADDAQGRLDAARRLLDDAVSNWEDAAARAAKALDHVANHDGLKDSPWDSMMGWVHDHAEVLSSIADWASKIATVLGLLALAVGWIPVIGQALAAVLGAAALVLSVIALSLHLVLALAGSGSWLDVAIDAVAVVTFGVGRAAIGGTKLAVAGTRAAMRSTAVESIIARTVAARGGAVTGKSLARITKGAWRQVAQGTAGAGRRASQLALDAAPRTGLPSLTTLAEGFDPAVLARETAGALRTLGNGAAWRAIRLPALRGVLPAIDPDVAVGIREILQSRPTTIPGLQAPLWSGLDGQLTTFYGSTGIGLATDLSDRFHLLDPFKPALVGPPPGG